METCYEVGVHSPEDCPATAAGVGTVATRKTVEGTAFYLYLMHNVEVLVHRSCVPPLTRNYFRTYIALCFIFGFNKM